MTAAEVLVDLQNIKSLGFNHIRMYSVDCNQLSTTADQAISLGMQLTLGVFIDSTGTTRGYSDLEAIISWGNWANVVVINLGTHHIKQL